MYIMPLQKKKKKKPAKPKAKTPTVSQKVSQVVKINIGDVKPKPRRRAAPRKPPAGGGRGGFPPAPPSGLVQQVQAPQVTQDVLQQSKELREIVNKLQTSPAQQTLRGQEAGGQPENILRDFVPRTEMVRRDKDIYDRIRQSEQTFGEEIAMAMAEAADREGDRQEDMSDISSSTGSLAGFTMAETVKSLPHGLDTNIPEARAVVFEDHAPPVGTLRPGRGAGLTEEQREQIRRDFIASGMSVNAYNMSGRNPIGDRPISINTLSSLFRDFGGVKGYKERQGN